MVPDFNQLKRPVLEKAAEGERSISIVVEELADELQLSPDDREELLPSGKQTRFANRVHWAKSYLKQAGLLKNTKRGYFEITQRGQTFLANHEGEITKEDLEKFEEFRQFQTRTNRTDDEGSTDKNEPTFSTDRTPDEIMRKAYENINATLSIEIIDRIRDLSPLFFERLIIELLIAMGYGGSAEDAGRNLGQSGDGGVDGVIDQDPLGVDQVFIQAKRYAEKNNIGAGAIRDFFGALNLKRANKGIFFTTSKFTPDAKNTAANLGMRIVLIDGDRLARLMIKYNIGCRTEDTLMIKKIDEDFFETF